jgi:hypothetical protein
VIVTKSKKVEISKIKNIFENEHNKQNKVMEVEMISGE